MQPLHIDTLLDMGREHIIEKSGQGTVGWEAYRGPRSIDQLVEDIQSGPPLDISIDTVRLICTGAVHTLTEEQAREAVGAENPEGEVREHLEELIEVVFPKPV